MEQFFCFRPTVNCSLTDVLLSSIFLNARTKASCSVASILHLRLWTAFWFEVGADVKPVVVSVQFLSSLCPSVLKPLPHVSSALFMCGVQRCVEPRS